MKKVLFLLIAIMTLGITLRASADVAAPAIDNREIVIKVEVKDEYNASDIQESIGNMAGIKSVEIIPANECEKCETCEVCGAGESLSDKDIKSLKNATLIIYITLGILVVLMIIVIALMVSKRKKDSKKDA